MKKKSILILLITTISSCIVEETGYTRTLLVNNTNHLIEVIPFYQGSVYQEFRFTIKPQETITVFERHDRLKTLNPCFGSLIKPFDSVKVVFDNLVAVKHLNYDGQSNLGIPFSNNRNITNSSNYTLVIESETKYSIKGYYYFTFMEQDYLDASQ